MSKWILLKFFMVVLVATCNYCLAAGDIANEFKDKTRFTTWQGIEPDKWATVWLIKRYISPDAYFLLVPPNSDVPSDAIPFGLPGAQISRTNHQSMFHNLKQQVGLEGNVLDYFGSIIHDVEVNIWDAPQHPHSLWFENLYRQLQARYQRDQVPIDCYLAFFDAVAIQAENLNVSAKEYKEQIDLSMKQCPGLNQEESNQVAQFNYIDVLREISLGKRVIFVDTREDEEYNEVHLPGAVILRLRDVNPKRVEFLEKADLVIPYCVKDFRGFEVAKAIKRLGISHVAILSPNGIKGWLAAGLPVAKKDLVSDENALEELMRCAMEAVQCVTHDIASISAEVVQ